MSVNSHCFVEWKEQFVSQERGNRVVHYFLKDFEGQSILAIIGTERSIRHMFYVVAEEFVHIYGAESSVRAGFKWRSRREVVDWLTSMLSKEHLQGDQSKSLEHDAARALVSLDCPTNGISVRQNQLRVDMGYLSRNMNGKISEIVWSGIVWTCGKQLKHYPAFCRNGTSIKIRSFVFVMAKGHHHYLAYVEDMYEDKRGQKKVKVRWFHHTQEVKGVIPLRNPHPKEVFITPYVQVISAECVDGPATVLTREHYEKSEPSFPQALLARIHMCYRQFRSNRVKPFDLRKLHGYYDQSIFSFYPGHFSMLESGCHDLSGEEGEEFSPSNVKVGAKRTRSGKACRPLLRDHTHVSGERGPIYRVYEKIELLCQDSGIRGCWFRCTVLQISRKQIKVQYDDVHEEDGCGNLEEWIPTFRLAVPDKLGMRYTGRSIIRPAPPHKDKKGIVLEVGTAVDAWWSDGWWEGIVSRVDKFGDDTLQIFFPGENLFLNIHKKDLRISMDWVGDHWIEIATKPDILSTISPVISTDPKVSTPSTIAKDGIYNACAMPPPEVPSNTSLYAIEEEQSEIAAVANSDCPPGSKHWMNDKNSVLLKKGVPNDSDENMKENPHEDKNAGEDRANNNKGLKLDRPGTEDF